MARRNAPAVEARKRRLLLTLVWSAVTAALVIFLIFKEQIALLYIIATVSVTALLVIVALADLHGAQRTTLEPPLNDAAALADGPPARTLKPTPARAAARRR